MSARAPRPGRRAQAVAFPQQPPAASWRERWRYRFDNWMSRGTGAIMTLLGAATLTFVVVVALMVMVAHANPGPDQGGFWDVAWGNLMRTLDPGTMGGDVGWAFRILMLLVTIGGLVIVASLIGIVSGAFNDKMVALRRGRSRVIETDHTLLLGWNSQLFTILEELKLANASRTRSTVVVLADLDKVDMETRIRERLPELGTTAIVCRRGDPLSQHDLHLGSPHTARSIIILPDDADAHPDASVIKTALALTSQLPAEGGPSVIAELRDPANLEAARLASPGRAQWLVAGELISRMTVQTCLQGGLSTVCTELLDFDGDEVYFTEQPDLQGSTYLQAQLSFARSTVMGIEREGSLVLNPPAEEVVRAGDRLVVIAEDDSAIQVTEPRQADVSVMSGGVWHPRPAERILILGYNSSLQWMLDDLASCVAAGSSVRVVADVDVSISPPSDIAVDVIHADTTSRQVLDALSIGSHDHVLVLAYRDDLDTESADAKTLVTLLHLRDIVERHGLSINIVTEMLEDRNRDLAEVARPDDFIVSNRLVSLMLAQVSENSALVPVFEELFSGIGTEIFVRPADLYITCGCEADFYTVAAAAARRGETAIGFGVAAEADTRSRAFGVHLNPDKSERLTFVTGDSVIVLAETA